MKAHVPKTTAQIPSPETQLLELRSTLLASDAFARVRGTFGRSLEDLVARDIIGCESHGIATRKSRSRSAILKDVDTLLSDIRFCAIHLARLRRDGHTVAYRELLRLLQSSDHHLIGEEAPAERSHPLTLVIPNFPALRRIAEITLAQPTGNDGYHTQHTLLAALHEDETLLALLPTLTRAAREVFNRASRGTITSILSLPVAYREDTIEVAEAIEKLPNAIPLTIGLRIDRGESEVPYMFRILFEWLTAAWLVDGEQSDVLSLFPRAKQGSISTWQLRLPVRSSSRDLSKRERFSDAAFEANLVLFFPEEELASRRRLRPSHTSRGSACGHGIQTAFVPGLAHHTFIDLQSGSDQPPPFGLVRMGKIPALPLLADLARGIMSRPTPSEEVTKVG